MFVLMPVIELCQLPPVKFKCQNLSTWGEQYYSYPQPWRGVVVAMGSNNGKDVIEKMLGWTWCLFRITSSSTGSSIVGEKIYQLIR